MKDILYKYFQLEDLNNFDINARFTLGVRAEKAWGQL
jgi:hypothetical protein